MNVKSRVCLFGTFAVVCAAGLFSTGCRTEGQVAPVVPAPVVPAPVVPAPNAVAPLPESSVQKQEPAAKESSPKVKTVSTSNGKGGTRLAKAQVKPVVPAPNAVAPLPVSSVQKYEPEAIESFLKVKAVSTFNGKDGARLNEELLKAANAVFVERGFKVSDDVPDVIVTLSPGVSVFDKTGEYFLMEGKADASAALANANNRLVATKSFAVKGERKLGAEKAEQDVADKLADQFKAWARNEITVEKTGLVAKKISVKCKYHDDVADPAYISRFIDAVKSMEGVSDCSLVSQDNGARRFEFRTVYRKAAYPGGLLNALVVRHPELNLVLSK